MIQRSQYDGYRGTAILKGASNGNRERAASMTAAEMLTAIWRRRLDVMQATQFAGARTEGDSAIAVARDFLDADDATKATLSGLVGQQAYEFLVEAMGAPLADAVKALKPRRIKKAR